MKRLITLLLAASTLAGCKTEIDHAEAVIRNDLIYKYGDTDPFSGLLLNIPGGPRGIAAHCNSQIEKGRRSGKTECFYRDNGQKIYEADYLAGNKDGAEFEFDFKTGDKISVINWKNGRQDGVEEKYRNGNLVSRKEYKDGKPDGDETRWSDDGETVLTELTWRAGKKYDGYETTSEGYKGNYLNGQLHGPQKHGSTEENYENGKLHGVQKKFVSPLFSGVIQQESEVTYDNGVALSGWFKQFKDMDGSVIQEIKLVQSPHRNDEDFRTKYPGDLVPDGLVRFYDRETESINGEEVWVNGVKIKEANVAYAVPTDGSYEYGDMIYSVLDTTAPYEKYKNVSKEEYFTYGAPPSLNSSAIDAKTSSVATSDNCLDAWITVFREEVGEEALIVSEQLNEWKDWCSEGKLP